MLSNQFGVDFNLMLVDITGASLSRTFSKEVLKRPKFYQLNYCLLEIFSISVNSALRKNK